MVTGTHAVPLWEPKGTVVDWPLPWSHWVASHFVCAFLGVCVSARVHIFRDVCTKVRGWLAGVSSAPSPPRVGSGSLGVWLRPLYLLVGTFTRWVTSLARPCFNMKWQNWRYKVCVLRLYSHYTTKISTIQSAIREAVSLESGGGRFRTVTHLDSIVSNQSQ